MLLDILGICSVLESPEHRGFLDRWVPAADRVLPPLRYVERAYPVCWWRAEHGANPGQSQTSTAVLEAWCTTVLRWRRPAALFVDELTLLPLVSRWPPRAMLHQLPRPCPHGGDVKVRRRRGEPVLSSAGAEEVGVTGDPVAGGVSAQVSGDHRAGGLLGAPGAAAAHPGDDLRHRESCPPAAHEDGAGDGEDVDARTVPRRAGGVHRPVGGRMSCPAGGIATALPARTRGGCGTCCCCGAACPGVAPVPIGLPSGGDRRAQGPCSE